MIFFDLADKLICFYRDLIAGNADETCFVTEFGAIEVGTGVISNDIERPEISIDLAFL